MLHQFTFFVCLQEKKYFLQEISVCGWLSHCTIGEKRYFLGKCDVFTHIFLIYMPLNSLSVLKQKKKKCSKETPSIWIWQL